MKKYLFGLVATVFAVAMVAFTTPKKSMDTKIYRYDGTTVAGAATANNWSDVSLEGTPSCASGDALPCHVTFETSQFLDIEAFINGRDGDDVLEDPLVTKKAE